MAAWIRQHAPQTCVSSPAPLSAANKLRKLLSAPPDTDPRLGTGSDVADLLAAAGWPDGGHGQCRAVLIVGHQPTSTCGCFAAWRSRSGLSSRKAPSGGSPIAHATTRRRPFCASVWPLNCWHKHPSAGWRSHRRTQQPTPPPYRPCATGTSPSHGPGGPSVADTQSSRPFATHHHTRTLNSM